MDEPVKDLALELVDIDRQTKELELRKSAIYKESLARPDDQKVCKDWIAEQLAELSPVMEFPITVTGIAWEGSVWEEIPAYYRIQPGGLASVRVAGDTETCLGIFIGELVIHESASLDQKTGLLRVRKFGGNPTFWVPKLKRVVMGCESWWSPIKSAEELKAITDVDIQSVWYVQAMQAMMGETAPAAPETTSEPRPNETP